MPTSPAYLRIEDELDRLGQRLRVRKLVRGGLLCGATVMASTVALGAIAHVTPAGSTRLWILLAIWIAVTLAAVVAWVVRPLMFRLNTIRVARELEARVGSLHNGLTNSVLLARRSDAVTNPYLEPIFDEVEAGLNAGSLRNAIPWNELHRLAIACSSIIVIAAVAWLSTPGIIGHGVRQLFAPSAFVQRIGAAKLVGVMPGDVTLVAGDALELSAVADAPAGSPAEIVFEHGPESTSVLPASNEKLQRYTYRLDHVDAPLQYRVEIAGTQSRWYRVDVVKDISLTSVTLVATPPSYTGVAPITFTGSAEQLESSQVSFPQGSSMVLSASFDVPANSAVLNRAQGHLPPLPMETEASHRTFHATFPLDYEMASHIALIDAGGQMLAYLPSSPLPLRCTKDLPPSVQLNVPAQDVTISPKAPLQLKASLQDDYGLTTSRILIGYGGDGPMNTLKEWAYPSKTKSIDLDVPLDIPADRRASGDVVRLQVQSVDNCGLESGPQTTSSSVVTISFQDPAALAQKEMQSDDQLRTQLAALLAEQIRLNGLTTVQHPVMKPIASGQSTLLDRMKSLAETFAFDASNRVVQKTLLVLVLNPGKDATDRSQTLLGKNPPPSAMTDLLASQRQIIDALQSLLARLGPGMAPPTRPTGTGNDPLVSRPDAFKAMDDALKQYEAQQRKLLDQAAGLAKKPVDDFSDKDQKLLSDLLQQQDKLDAFMASKVADFSKLAEQDMANASMVKDAMQIMTEVTLAKDALKQQAMEIAVPAEENGLEGAKELSSNLERWLTNAPDRQQWTQEELPQHSDTPMPELPAELQDMVGQLIEQQEDLFDQVEDMNANITDSADKGIGWDAMDGPIADMSAKGVTGNVLPNNNETGGRSGEGRSGQSQGEFVGNTAVGKGGRNTPTRLDPTPFQTGQIADTSKDPVGGATGGGKLSGSGAAGLEGPVPPKLSAEMKRLATKQAEIRNTAERIALQYKVGRYDNFKLDESIALMRRVQSDLNENRYRTALRQRDVLVESLDTSRLLLAGQLHVQQDSTPTTSIKSQQELSDAAKGNLPAAWSDSLKTYYQKLAAQ